MEHIQRQSIYDQLSAKGLIGEVLAQVRKHRPKASRNTIHLSFLEGPTTPTRRMILQVAEEVLAQAEVELEEVEAAA